MQGIYSVLATGNSLLFFIILGANFTPNQWVCIHVLAKIGLKISDPGIPPTLELAGVLL
jgi:hypothetical protein